MPPASLCPVARNIHFQKRSYNKLLTYAHFDCDKTDIQEVHDSTVGAFLKFFSAIPAFGEMEEDEEGERMCSGTDTLVH